MTQIEKYIERLKTLQNLYEEGQPQHNVLGIAIIEANKMLVKNCSIPDVVGRDEQIVCHCETPTPEKIHGIIKACTTCKKAIQLCRCGKPEEKAYSPCCSLTCWCEQFE